MSRVFANVKNYFFIYLALIALSIGCTIYFLDLKNMPRNEENIAVFVGSKGNKKDLLTLFNEVKPNYIRRIQYRNFLTTDSKFSEYYKNYSYTLSDIVIIPSSKAVNADVQIVYSKLNEEVIDEFQNITSFYTIEDNFYGFKIHSKGSEDNTYLDYGQGKEDEDYYAFIKKGSIHGGSLSSSTYRTALDFIKAIYL